MQSGVKTNWQLAVVREYKTLILTGLSDIVLQFINTKKQSIPVILHFLDIFSLVYWLPHIPPDSTIEP